MKPSYKEEMGNRYPDLNCLFLHLFEDIIYNDDYSNHPIEENDLRVIKEFVAVPTFHKEDMEAVLKQGREVLTLKPFPSGWIWGVLFGTEPDPEEDDSEICKERLIGRLAMLESEARKIGKL